MHCPMRGFYSDSDDDRPSSSDSITSASQCTSEPRLPSSLRKLLNPAPPPSLSPVCSPSTDLAQATLAGTCLAKQRHQEKGDLARLRPWKRLPLPRPLNREPPVQLPPIYLCIPASRNLDRSSGSCSTIRPQFNPYYLPAPRVYRERSARVAHPQTLSQIEEPYQVPDSPGWSQTATPSSPCSLASADIREARTSNNEISREKLNSSFHDSTCPRTKRPVVPKTPNNSQEKERNRCLTCGSSFSTFANLTRHEKKCAVDSKNGNSQPSCQHS